MLEGLKSPMTIGRLKGWSEKGKVWQGWTEWGERCRGGEGGSQKVQGRLRVGRKRKEKLEG